jgi:hypothetical protein
MGLTSTWNVFFDRHTTAEIATLETEAGFIVYDTTLAQFVQYNATNGAWEALDLQSATNQIGNDLKTSYNRITGYTKIDNRPASGTSAGTYALQVRGYMRDATGQFFGVDNEADLYTTGTTFNVRGASNVAKVRSGVTATDATLIGCYGQARVDTGGVLAGDSFLAGLYGLIEAGPAMTANHVCSLWLDTHQANTVTGKYSLLYATENGAEALDQVMYFYTPQAVNFAEFDTCTAFMGTGAKSGGTAKTIKISIDGVTHYINAWPS